VVDILILILLKYSKALRKHINAGINKNARNLPEQKF